MIDNKENNMRRKEFYMEYIEPSMEIIIMDDIFTRLGQGSVDYGTVLTGEGF